MLHLFVAMSIGGIAFAIAGKAMLDVGEWERIHEEDVRLKEILRQHNCDYTDSYVNPPRWMRSVIGTPPREMLAGVRFANIDLPQVPDVVEALSKWERLYGISFTNCRLSAKELSRILEGSHVRSVYLTECDVDAASASVLASEPTIDRLDVTSSKISAESFERILRETSTTNLRVDLPSIDDDTLSAVLSQTDYAFLELSRCKLGSAECAKLAAMPKLQQLKLNRCALTAEGVRELARSSSLRVLKFWERSPAVPIHEIRDLMPRVQVEPGVLP